MLSRPSLFAAALGIAAVLVAFEALSWADTAATLLVSQKGRAFNPKSLTIKQGDTVTLVNDDGDLIHHAYVDSPAFSFDSGDQQPGSKVNIRFTKTGIFNVLCGIHPKMKMTVDVH